MSIELYCKCDNCKTQFYSDGEAVYCAGCYEALEKEIETLNDRIRELEKELESPNA